MQSREKDHLVDAILFATVFYLLSHESSVHMTQQFAKRFPSFMDATLVRALIFAVIYIFVQKMTKRM